MQPILRQHRRCCERGGRWPRQPGALSPEQSFTDATRRATAASLGRKVDLTGDGVVNFVDLAKMKSVFFQADENADLNADGVVNFADLAIKKESFFKKPGPAAGKP